MQTKFYMVTGKAFLNSPTQFRRLFPIDLLIVPTLGPLEENERYLEDETVRRNEVTRLANRVFHNLWLRRPGSQFDAFRELVQESWPNISIQRPEHKTSSTRDLQMLFEENRIVREVYGAGFGFQVWLQLLTQLMRADSDSVLVIDEPDIYLHPDLQRKLVKIIRDRFHQFVMATHSIEKMKASREI